MNTETIAAISTAPGESGIGVIRVSGPDAANIGAKVFVPAGKKPPENRQLTYGHIKEPETGKVVDEVMCVFLPGPHTYTTEDMLEIYCHGGMVPLRRTLQLVLACGAVPAGRGEFTKRAFLGGRIDLSQAEAVMDLISAKTDRSFDSAMGQLSGVLSQKIGEIRAKFVDVLVDLTVNIDYPDEDIEQITYEKLGAMLEDLIGDVRQLLSGADSGRILREGLRVSIVGKPNVGKSSLMNALLRQSRAIVTDIPGTTRDTIEESLDLRGIPIVLTDTAGIRNTKDVIEQVGIERTQKSLEEADLVVWMLDSSVPFSEEDQRILEQIDPAKTLILLNKTDLTQQITIEDVQKKLPEGAEILETAVKSEESLQKIEDSIERRVNQGLAPGQSAMITNARHKGLLEQTAAALEEAAAAVRMREPLELIEIDVNEGYLRIGEIIGEEVAGDVLDAVFERFCLGK